MTEGVILSRLSSYLLYACLMTSVDSISANIHVFRLISRTHQAYIKTRSVEPATLGNMAGVPRITQCRLHMALPIAMNTIESK